MKYFVAQGSVYCPGWSVIEQLTENRQRVLATFFDEKDADDFLVYLQDLLAKEASL